MGVLPDAVPGPVSPKTILLVEDEAIVAADEARLLREEGYAVLTAASGNKAIEAVRARPGAIDLILMDIDLGRGMDGARAAREILKEQDIPILFLSSHTEKAVVEKTEKITSYGYVVKDSGIIVLSASIKMAFKLHKAHRELERHEEALRESRERFSNAFECAAIGMALVSPEGRWLQVNRSLCGILGYSEEEMLAKTFQDLTHPEDVEASLAPFRRLLAGDLSTYQLKKRYLHKEGGIIWAQLTVSIVRGKEGLPFYVIAQIQDITESKRAGEALREMSEVFRLFMEYNPTYVFIKDAGIRPVFLSRNYEKMLGRPLPDLLGKSMDELFPSELSKSMIADDQRILREGKPVNDIVEVLAGRTYSTLKFPILIDGVPRYLAGYTVDITDRKGAEEALRKSESRYRSLFEHMEEGVAYCRMLFDERDRPTDFVYLAVNQAFQRLTGLKDVEGRLVTDVIPGIKEQTPELFEAYGRVASTGRPEKFEIDFTPLGVWLSVSVYSPGKGEFVAVFDNITGRKRTEEEIKKAQLLLRSSIESPREMIILSIDRQYRYLYFNDWHREVMRAAYGKDVRIGMNLLECVTNEDDRRKARLNYDRALAGEAHSTVEEYGDLDRSYYETFYSPIVDDKGEIIGATAFARNVTDRKRAEKALKETIRQKEVLLKELQHRVKNSLAVVSGLLGLEMENLTEPRSREIFANTRSRIRSIASLYEQLCGAVDVAHVDLRRYIGRLTESLFDTYAPKTGNIVLKTELDEVTLETKRAVPLGLILNELVMNAIKYAYPPGAKGEIRVVLERSAERITLGVSDDGVGLPPGFVSETSGGMGWSLIRMLAEEIDARLTVESKGGCRVLIGFDLNEA